MTFKVILNPLIIGGSYYVRENEVAILHGHGSLDSGEFDSCAGLAILSEQFILFAHVKGNSNPRQLGKILADYGIANMDFARLFLINTKLNDSKTADAREVCLAALQHANIHLPITYCEVTGGVLGTVVVSKAQGVQSWLDPTSPMMQLTHLQYAY